MIYSIVSEFKLIQFYFKHFVQFKLFPEARKKNIFLSGLVNILSLFVLLISLIPMLIIAAFYLALYVLVGFLIALVVVLLISLSGEINKELWTSIISLTVAGAGILVAVINYILTSKKSFSENKMTVYISLIEVLYQSIDGFKQGKELACIPKLPEVSMYSSNIVLRLLCSIKRESSTLKNEIDKRSIIYKTMFLVDYMRDEIKQRGNGFTFFEYQFSDLRILCNGELAESNTISTEIINTDKKIEVENKIETENFKTNEILTTENEEKKAPKKTKTIKKQKNPVKK